MRIAMGVVALALTAGFASADLMNPGFESGTGADADNWFELGFGDVNAGAGRDDSSPRTGDWAMWLEVDGGDGVGTRAFAEQSGIAVSEGDDITFTVWGMADGALGPGVVASTFISFFDAGGGFLGVMGNGITLTDGVYTEYSYTIAAPTGAASATVGMDLSGGAFDASDGRAYFDDASVEVVPAPASIAAVFGGLALTTRRRRG